MGVPGGGHFFMSEVPLQKLSLHATTTEHELVSLYKGVGGCFLCTRYPCNQLFSLLSVRYIAFSSNRESAPCSSELYRVMNISRCQTEVHANRPIRR